MAIKTGRDKFLKIPLRKVYASGCKRVVCNTISRDTLYNSQNFYYNTYTINALYSAPLPGCIGSMNIVSRPRYIIYTCRTTHYETCHRQ